MTNEQIPDQGRPDPIRAMTEGILYVAGGSCLAPLLVMVFGPLTPREPVAAPDTVYAEVPAPIRAEAFRMVCYFTNDDQEGGGANDE